MAISAAWNAFASLASFFFSFSRLMRSFLACRFAIAACCFAIAASAGVGENSQITREGRHCPLDSRTGQNGVYGGLRVLKFAPLALTFGLLGEGGLLRSLLLCGLLLA